MCWVVLLLQRFSPGWMVCNNCNHNIIIVYIYPLFWLYEEMFLILIGTVFWYFTLIGSDPTNVLGLSPREVRLAERVREMEQQNQLLRRQLSISQNQLIQAWGDDREEGLERGREGTGNKSSPRCKDKVIIFRVHLEVIYFYITCTRKLL